MTDYKHKINAEGEYLPFYDNILAGRCIKNKTYKST